MTILRFPGALFGRISAPVSLFLGLAWMQLLVAIPFVCGTPPDESNPVAVSHYAAGDLQMAFRHSANGLELAGLVDLKTQTRLANYPLPLFRLNLRHAVTKQDQALTSVEGWRSVSLRRLPAGLKLRWHNPEDNALAGLAVTMTAKADDRSSAWRWSLAVENHSQVWCVRGVVFPQLNLADLGNSAKALFPRGPGELQAGIWNRSFQYHGNYPDGWCAMQFMAAYREDNPRTGLYVGFHDPWGGTKRLELKSDPTNHNVRLAFEVPMPDLNRAGNDCSLSGEVVWRLLRGDWFDAATIYRTWARQEARWWPRLGRDGRTDTAPWMRELSAWVMTGGAPSECVPSVKRFREALDVPVGFHWYNWHQIPFDNDYPHYFPTRAGFAQGVAELLQAGVYTMPYINGRLWDSRDRAAEDFEFSRIALPATTKQEDGQPYLETYGSKETNGQPVRLAVMCPTTRLWQDKVRGIVLRLLRDEGTRGVYIDQVAAAAPKLCMDAEHDHPVGGGHWWNEGYWTMLRGIRRQMPSDRMLTTECNAEPFIRHFDGYLTWHWQYDGQVPAFPAIYGGAIQMFGRAYRGGATKDLALRMKSGQQLVFGEQIGWFDPGMALEPQNLGFVKKVIHTRWNYRRYFYAGQMLRPPRLLGECPQVKADWQWSGEWWVTTDAVLTGAWGIPAEKRSLLLFVNVIDQPQHASFYLDTTAWGGKNSKLLCSKSVNGQKPIETGFVAVPSTQSIELPPQSVLAMEITSPSAQ